MVWRTGFAATDRPFGHWERNGTGQDGENVLGQILDWEIRHQIPFPASSPFLFNSPPPHRPLRLCVCCVWTGKEKGAERSVLVINDLVSVSSPVN